MNQVAGCGKARPLATDEPQPRETTIPLPPETVTSRGKGGGLSDPCGRRFR